MTKFQVGDLVERTVQGYSKLCGAKGRQFVVARVSANDRFYYECTAGCYGHSIDSLRLIKRGGKQMADQKSANRKWSFKINGPCNVDYNLIGSSLSKGKPVAVIQGLAKPVVVIHCSLTDKLTDCKGGSKLKDRLHDISELISWGDTYEANMLDKPEDLKEFLAILKQVRLAPLKKSKALKTAVTVTLASI